MDRSIMQSRRSIPQASQDGCGSIRSTSHDRCIAGLLLANDRCAIILIMLRKLAFIFLFLFAVTPTIGIAGQTDDRLDELFARLLATNDPVEAQQLEQIIWLIWKRSEKESINILMQQGEEAMNSGDFATALQTFNAMVNLEPEFAEGWNKRATVHYLIDNYNASVADVERTLVLEPRHFGALAGLGLVYDALKEKKKALEAYRSALAIHPHLFGVKLRIDQLTKEVEGQRI